MSVRTKLRLAAFAIAVTATTFAMSAAAAGRQKWVVYQSSSLRLVHTDGTGDHALTSVPNGDQEHPDWSPDGSRIAFDVDFGAIWVVGVDGGAPHAVFRCTGRCAFLQDGAWSPDGKSIAFIRDVATADGQLTDHADVVVLNLATGRTRAVVTLPRPTDVPFSPRWSPDGRHLVYEVDRFVDAGLSTSETSGSWLETVDLRTSRRRLLGDRGSWASQPDWGRNGIVFSVGRPFTTDDMNLIVASPDGRLCRPLTRFHGTGDRALQPTWVPRSNSVVFTHVRDDRWATPTASFIDAGSGELSIGVFGDRTMTHARVQP